MKKNMIAALLLFLSAPFFFSSPLAAEFHCEQRLDQNNSFICAPPRGSLLKNRYGKYVCGPGRCVVKNSDGEVICAAAPGGAVALDSRGRSLCVGGCVRASEALCVVPVPDDN